MQQVEKKEAILAENRERFVLFPIKHKEIWEMYKKAEHRFWAPGEISWKKDQNDLQTQLNSEEKEKLLLALRGLHTRVKSEHNEIASALLTIVQYPEARCFFGFQVMMQSIHAEIYSDMVHKLQIDQSPNYTGPEYSMEIQDWLKFNFTEAKTFSQKILSAALSQRIFGMSLFSLLQPLYEKDLLPAARMFSRFVYEDEGLFTDFLLTVYSGLENKLDQQEVFHLVNTAVQIETEFCSGLNNFLTSRERLAAAETIKMAANEIMLSIYGECAYKITGKTPPHLKWVREFIPVMPPAEKDPDEKTIRFDAEF